MIPNFGGGLDNSGGSMPIDAGGGSAGPSAAHMANQDGYRMGNLVVGGQSSTWPILLAVVVTAFVVKKYL
jgi:hypothetical protein